MRRRIKHNNLLPWFTQDHVTLPASYLRSCEKFFKSIKPQAASLTGDLGYDRMNLERNNYDTKTSIRKNKNSG